MYYGEESEVLLGLRREYEKMFGYDPNGDVEIEISDHGEYCDILRRCIVKKKDIFELLDI